ncbi:protein kinase domain-containing protein [Nonomuraea jabiensis]|uniref:serine/threonine-protein kinase n=1 Tax=Nonomuraea jabiensis TaxID=882448 RepID=UPI003D70B4F3
MLGCLAHGGLGWIYLARDKNVSDRWVVLKGLLNTGDADAMAAALAERRFLAEVEHPNVVKIYNFAQHATGGYIVMEYVGGQSLRQLREAGPLPLPQVIAYGLEILRAFGYLHDQGLLYCDLKPDNVLQSQEQLKLIDLGGVRRIDDEDGAIYGTAGYQAPEIAERGPSVASDLYTVGRTLAVLSFDFRGNASSMKHALPDVLPLPESFALLLRRATDPDPGCASGRPPTWPSSSPACCARWSPRRTAGRDRPPPPCSARRSAPPGARARPSRACPARSPTRTTRPPRCWPASRQPLLRADRYQRAFLEKSQQLAGLSGASLETYDSRLDSALQAYAADHGDVRFTGFFGTAFGNITFPGERELAEQTVAAFRDYQRDDRKMRALRLDGDLRAAVAFNTSYAEGNSNYHFDRYDKALERFIALNHRHFEASIRDGETALSGWTLIPAAGALLVAALTLMGVRPRLNEYR